jgi:hypothetical protein
MAISYKPLWHLLVEKEMNKEDLKRAANITSNIVSRMSKNAYVNLDSIEKICLALDCRIEDVVEIVREGEKND